MATCLRTAASSSLSLRASSSKVVPKAVAFRQRTRHVAIVRAQSDVSEKLGLEVGRTLALSSVAASWIAAGNAQAATEIAGLAASDERLGVLSVLLVPVLGWVAFNIAGPASRQIEKMSGPAPKKTGTAKLKKAKAGVAAVVGLGGASMLLADNADAATEVMNLAASDSRFSTIALLLVPVLGWVAFNIVGPAQRQLAKLSETSAKPTSTKKLSIRKAGVAAALGLSAASLLSVQSADAATQFAQIADGDARVSILTTLLLPVLGWVAFNIYGPATRQLEKLQAPAPKKTGTAKLRKAGFAIAATSAAAATSLFGIDSADAAAEFSQLAASDSRAGILFTLLVPVLGWVAFNIAGPALRQIGKMSATSAPPKKSGTSVFKSKKAALLAATSSAAALTSMFAVSSADAAVEMSQLADSDGRAGILVTLLVPVLGWVAFNIAAPAFRQLEKMSSSSSKPTGKTGTKVAKKK